MRGYRIKSQFGGSRLSRREPSPFVVAAMTTFLSLSNYLGLALKAASAMGRVAFVGRLSPNVEYRQPLLTQLDSSQRRTSY
jgi:hypothetical protein